MSEVDPRRRHPGSLRELAPGSFVYLKADALAPELCDRAIERFEAASDEHYRGRVGQLAQAGGEVKKSTDLVVSGKPHWHDIDRALCASLGAAMAEFRAAEPFFRGPFKDLGYAIQRTLPGEYYAWHVDGGSHEFSHRQLVAIWYLNDVPGPGGATEFYHQAISVQPRRGALLLFPPFWTHRHRGAKLRAGVKYIATTWVVFA